MTTPQLSKKINLISLILGPALFIILSLIPAPLPFNPIAWKVISVALWMITWWVTETVPLSVTAILPMVLFPLLGIFDISVATSSYAHPIIFLFLGGFLIALGIEKRNLHKRIALTMVRATGTHPNGIILGFMIATAFISMWISNTATTVMMLPIATSVINLLREKSDDISSRAFNRFGLCLLLGIAYAANIGGAMTIIGTPPNVVSIGYIREMLQIDVTFANWLAIGLPVGTLLIAIMYFIMTRLVFPTGIKNFNASAQILNQQIKELGPVSREEIMVSIVFVLTAACWILRQPINNLIGSNLLNDTIIAMAGGVLMFIIPVNTGEGEYLLDWESTTRLPWGILILFGGGLCLANGMETSGLVEFIGEQISSLGAINIILLTLILTTIMLFMTEIMSNVALATILIPVIISIAQGFGYSPMIMVVPATMAASYAFMMPVSTPPNAIVFSSGLIKIRDMMKIGFILNIISIVILIIMANLLVEYLFPG